MTTRRLGFLTTLSSLVLAMGCTANDGALADLGRGEPSGSSGGDEPRHDWSIPGAQKGWSADQSSTSTPMDPATDGAGGIKDGPTCSWGEPTSIHLTVPSWRTLASAPLARALTHAKKLPDPSRLYTGDFLNYYRVQYDAPAKETDFGFHMGAAPGALPNELVLQIAMQAPATFPRPQVALAVVVDTSLSMAGEPWKRAKAAAAALAGALRPGDSFTLVTSKRARSTGDAGDAPDIAAALELDGGEDLAGALQDGYEAATSGVQANGGVGRVVLISDGAAQPTSIDLGAVAGNLEKGVPLIGVGVGEAPSYDGRLLDAATSNGGGASLYVDSADEAKAVLGGRFDELMFTVASEIEVDVTLPPSLRFETLQPAVKADSPAGLVTAQLAAGRTLVIRNVLQTCEASIGVLSSETIGVVVSYRPAGDEPTKVELPGAIAQLLITDQPQIRKAGAISAYAEALAGVRPALLEVAAAMSADARKNEPSLADDADLQEIEGLIQADLEIAKAAAPAK
jgi:Ca-activated chloride channel family protein